MRLIAVDWSGSKESSMQKKHIWMADSHRGAVTLTSGRTREETILHIVKARLDDESLVVGFDFAFAFPAWFARELGCANAAELWKRAQDDGDGWLQTCPPPFWGHPGKTCPPSHTGPCWEGYRATERTILERTRRWPRSPFQIGGAGTVGPGSVRGMPLLLNLQHQGFCIWPFDPPGPATVIEIYPRLSVGKTKVSSEAERRAFICSGRFGDMPPEVREQACDSPDAFDALCALRDMMDHEEELSSLRPATTPRRLLEGEIWMPRRM